MTVFLFAFLSQFFDTEQIGLGGVSMLIILAVYAFANAAIRDLVLAAPVARQWIARVPGALLTGFAAKLAFTER